MDYEKKYKEALERARGIHSFSSDIAEIKRMEQIFPELAESEDERIRKAQLDYWRSVGGKEWHGVPVQETIAWLEKQGEQKEYTFKSLPRLLEMIEPTERAKAYCQKLIDALIKEGYATDAKVAGECLKQMNGEKVALATMDEEQGEQQSKWTEKDEHYLILCVECVKECAAQEREDFSKTIDWLNSLKQRMEE